jgi:hypothetical protein
MEDYHEPASLPLGKKKRRPPPLGKKRRSHRLHFHVRRTRGRPLARMERRRLSGVLSLDAIQTYTHQATKQQICYTGLAYTSEPNNSKLYWWSQV